MHRTSSYRSLGVGTLALLLSLAASSAAHAASVSYNAPFGFGLSPGNQVVNLTQWDPALYPGQVLVSVELHLDALIGANVTAENDGASPGNMSVNLTGFAQALSGPLSTTAVILQSAGPVAVGPTDGNPGSGPDFNNFGSLAGNDSDNDIIFAGFAPFVGNGTFATNVLGNGGFSVSGVSNSTIQVSNFGASGLVTVTYEWVPVPEPSSIVLGVLGACGLALAGWRRRRTG